MKITQLYKKLDYHFQQTSYIEQALTHRSAGVSNNERLEFLGDSILNFVISHALFAKFTHCSEGELSRLRAHLVKGSTLAEIALELGIGQALILGQGELKSGGFRRSSILADALEAIFGAIYLDAGLNECERVILNLYEKRLSDPKLQENLKDSKTMLQEFLQSKQIPLPIYKLVKITGEEHEQTFHVTCSIENLKILSRGKAETRRKAEQCAANEILNKLNQSDQA